jgi:hypothetical protein
MPLTWAFTVSTLEQHYQNFFPVNASVDGSVDVAVNALSASSAHGTHPWTAAGVDRLGFDHHRTRHDLERAGRSEGPGRQRVG